MQISLVTPLFNRLDLTRACLESAGRTLAGWDYEWIFIDDGSTDGTREFLQELSAADPRVRVVLNNAPRGYAANNNHGARVARAPLLCLLNNDTALLPGWLEPMARLARALPDVACVGNVQREPVSGLVDHAGIFSDEDGEVRHVAKDALAPPREPYLEWPAVTAACCVVRREVFLGLGGFDEAFHNGGEDVDFCLRAGTRGYRHFVANRSVIYHHISASPGRKEGEDRNRQLFRERWGTFLQTTGRTRRTLGAQRQAGRRYLRKHLWQPWRFNLWRGARAVEQALAPQPLTRQLDLALRGWFAVRDLFSRGRPLPSSDPPGQPPVFLVVGDGTLSPDRSGVPTVVRHLAGACGRLGAPVHPVTWRPATRSLRTLPPEWSVGLDAESLRGPVVKPFSAAVSGPSLAEWREELTDTPSLHELPPEVVPPGAWIVLPEVLYEGRTEAVRDYAHRHGWRLAVILHDALPNNEPAVFPWGVPAAHEAYLRAIAGADLVLPVSNFTLADWQRFLTAKALPVPPTTVCVPGADTCGRTRGVTPRRHDPAAPVRILCVSGVRPRKNHRTLLTAFALTMAARPDLDWQLSLVGVPRVFSEDNVPEAVRSFSHEHPGKVRWIEWVEYSALRPLYEAADFTVFPSVLEGWGLPIVESLWFGKPCICANFGAMAETAAGGGCVTVDVRDPQALADAMLTLAGSPERLDELVAEIAARPLKTWEEYAREILEVLRWNDLQKETRSGQPLLS